MILPGNIDAKILHHLDPSHQRLMDCPPQCCASASAHTFSSCVLTDSFRIAVSLVDTRRD